MLALLRRLRAWWKARQERRHHAWIARLMAGANDPEYRALVEAERAETNGYIDLNDGGFTLTVPKRPRAVVCWAELAQIVAYKRDLLTTDLICVEFERRGSEHVEVTEDMAGFQALCDKFAAVCPGIPEDWWLQIALPPFATNYRLLWHAPDVVPHYGWCPKCGYDLTANESGRCPECGEPVDISSTPQNDAGPESDK